MRGILLVDRELLVTLTAFKTSHSGALPHSERRPWQPGQRSVSSSLSVEEDIVRRIKLAVPSTFSYSRAYRSTPTRRTSKSLSATSRVLRRIGSGSAKSLFDGSHSGQVLLLAEVLHQGSDTLVIHQAV